VRKEREYLKTVGGEKGRVWKIRDCGGEDV
jgi:hypothetical protein